MSDLLANRYRVVGALGQGAMGAVHRVADTLDGGREVALKRIAVPGAITPALRLRFKEEFRAMSRLAHPNTLAVYDYGELDAHTQYITMEVVPGQELGDVIGGRPMPLPEVYRLLIQLLQALAFIHARGYVHRDIKAANVRVREDGTLKLMDFGLMAPIGSEAEGAAVSGTPGYLAPEALRGAPVSVSTDLYAVGCLAYEMLTGTLPFPIDPLTRPKVTDVLRAHASSTPEPLRRRRADAPEALERVVMRLLAKEPQARYARATDVVADLADLAGVAVARETLEQRRSWLATASLVGREAEAGVLAEALAEAREGVGGAVWVAAPAGVGKSRLVHELAVQAKLDGVLVVRAQCPEHEGPPFEPLIQALRPLAAREPGLVAGDPSLARFFEPGGGEVAGAAEEARARLYEAVATLVRAVAAQAPVLLVLEDLHGGDAGTIGLLNHLARQAGGMPLLVLATLRDDETPPGSAAWYPVDEGAARALMLKPFGRPGVEALVRAMLRDVRVDEHVGRALYAATAGNAFFVTEVLRDLMEREALVRRDGRWEFPPDLGPGTMPTSVAATVERRLARLSGLARDLARVAAVLGRHQDRETFFGLSGLDDDVFFAAIDELVERQWLVPDPAGWAFPHDRVREALYAEMPAGLRRDLHARYAARLEAAHPDPGPELFDMAYHFARGTDPRKAFDYLRRAGDRARADGMVASALAYWREADGVLEGLDHAGKAADQAELWYRMGAVGFELAPPVAIAALEKLVGALRSVEAIEEAALAEDRLPRFVEAMAFLATAYGFAGRPARGLEVAERALALMPRANPVLRAALLMVRGPSLMPGGQIDALLATAKEAAAALADADLTGQPALVHATRVGAMSYQMAVCYLGERPDEAMLGRASEAATAIGATNLLTTIPHYMAVWRVRSGRDQEAAGFVDEALRNCRRIGAPPHPWALYLGAYIRCQRGEFAEAAAAVARAREHPHIQDQGHVVGLLALVEARVKLGQGDAAAAAEAFRATLAGAREARLGLVAIQALMGLGEAAMALGDFGAARVALAEAYEDTRVGATRNPLHQAIALRLLGELAIAEGAPAAARGPLDRALSLLGPGRLDNPLEEGHARRALGDMHAALQAREAAAEAWRQAGDRFHALGNRHGLHGVSTRLARLLQVEAPATPADEAGGDRWFQLRSLHF